MIDGFQPYGDSLGGYKGGQREFIVVNVRFERFNAGYDDFDILGFFLTSYTDDNYFEYDTKAFSNQPLEPFRLYYPEKETKSMAFEVMVASHNFILCYGITPGISAVTGKISSWCGAQGYEFKFGD